MGVVSNFCRPGNAAVATYLGIDVLLPVVRAALPVSLLDDHSFQGAALVGYAPADAPQTLTAGRHHLLGLALPGFQIIEPVTVWLI